MKEFKGKVLLITNVASQCGFTESNYKGLQELYDKYHSKGFEVGPSAPAAPAESHACRHDLHILAAVGVLKAWVALNLGLLQILAFPCNQFGNQEPGDSQTIKEFASTRCAPACWKVLFCLLHLMPSVAFSRDSGQGANKHDSYRILPCILDVAPCAVMLTER